MIRTLLFILFLLGAVKVSAQESANPKESAPRRHLMPLPGVLQFHTGRLPVDASFHVAVKGHKDARLAAGIERMVGRLGRRTGLEFTRAAAASPAPAGLMIECQGPGEAIPALGEVESYTLAISAQQARLSAATVMGALRGLETFLQLVESDQEGHYLPTLHINDQPRFPWRGLLIDVGRHYQPIAVIKRNLDGMAAVKLNVLHWHLTDDQGFRIESRRYPKLHQMGSDGFYYTQEQAREIIAYAAGRGIRVVPEFGMPGHATSWLVGHPELASAPGPYQIERRFGICDPVLDPTREEVYTLLDGFLGEMAALFPDAYMHIGGDENNGKHWGQNPKIQTFMKMHRLKDAHALQGHFNQRLAQILNKHGKKMIGWDEILHPDLPPDTVVQSWRGLDALVESAKKGYNTILSYGYYLDQIRPAAYHYAVDPLPAGQTLNPGQVARVLGGEACMWTEYVSAETIDSHIWPRLAAIAERLWSPIAVTDVPDMCRRLAMVSLRLGELGLTHEKPSAPR